MKTLEYKSFLAPITFGITGHRDVVPEDLDRAKKCIQNVVKKYRARFPTTPIIFLSPIAAGAGGRSDRECFQRWPDRRHQETAPNES